MSEVKIVSRRERGAVDIPSYVKIEDGLGIYRQGYGRALATAMNFFRKNVPVLEEALKDHVLSNLDTSKVHLVKSEDKLREVKLWVVKEYIMFIGDDDTWKLGPPNYGKKRVLEGLIELLGLPSDV